MLGVHKKIEKQHKGNRLMKFIRTGNGLKDKYGQDGTGDGNQNEDNQAKAENEQPSGYKLVEDFDSEDASE